MQHVPCSRSWRWRPTTTSSSSTLCDETELHLHEEEAPRHRASRHGETAGGGGGAGASTTGEAGSATTTREGENSAAAAGACHHHHDVPRQLVRQAGHRVPVKEPSRSFWYVLCAPAHVLIRSRHHWNDRNFLPSMTAIASLSGRTRTKPTKFRANNTMLYSKRELLARSISRTVPPAKIHT